MSLNTPSTDSELMQRVRVNDSKALEALYNRYSPILYTLIKKIVVDEEIAKDVLSDVFVIIWRKIDLFDFNSNNVYTWIITITRNKAVDTIRRARNSSEMEPYTEEYENNKIIPKLSQSIDPVDLETANNIREEVEAALNKLTDAQQFVINLAYYEGLTQKEIADRLKIPVATVKSKIKIALGNLKNNLVRGDI
ncbi:MAG: sigma-70 family RNA polymerase sigma factor [Ignavibacteriaceae bacterium]|nr:sigma-70 family RNA polymerase sigma factor [Ignavibacteriaceae bacterium]